MNQGFVDLRAENGSAGSSASFWPSFTDVMMVVVMIFIMASVLLVMRNWELVDELRATIEAERQAQATIRSTSEVNRTLEDQLTEAQNQITELRMELMRRSEALSARDELLAQRDQELTELRSERQRLATDLESARHEAESLQEQLQQNRDQLEAARQASERQAARLTATLEELSRARADASSKATELEQLRQQQSTSEQTLASLQTEYDSLKVKYDKLVKPARTAKGKYVVEVRYEKRGGYYHIKMKKPGDKGYTAVSRKQLHQRLSALKKEHPGKLYIKIIIPEKSGLSYNEAWRFTTDILSKYDYYHAD